jgi:phosphate transport system substrate-binding protein
MSREMKPEEIDKFQKKFGYEPTCLPTSVDMLAVYVHKDNPIADKGLTLDQVDAIFSKNRKAGFAKDIQTWGDLGLEGDWAKEPIRLYGRNEASGTYVYFKEHILKNGDYKDTVKAQPGSSAVVQSVGEDRFAIGYSGIGYKTANVKAVPLVNPKTKKLVEARPENRSTYPLARYLYLCLNYKPKSQLQPLAREFIKFVFSKEGQQIVDKDGYLPLEEEEIAESLVKVGLGKTSAK